MNQDVWFKRFLIVTSSEDHFQTDCYQTFFSFCTVFDFWFLFLKAFRTVKVNLWKSVTQFQNMNFENILAESPSFQNM